MRRGTALTAAAAALLLLAGCADDEGSSSSGSEPAAEARTKDGVPGTATAAAPPSSTAPTSQPADPGTGTAEVNERGNIEMLLGDEGGITDEAGADLVTFAISAITPDIACDSGFDDPPVNGHYIGVDLRVTTTALVTPDDYVSFSEYDFAFIGPDGITVTSVDGNAYTCLSDAKLFPYDDLGPGQTYVGTIVIDAPAASGILIFVPSLVSGTGGWEWQF